jgi:hypothetical protein
MPKLEYFLVAESISIDRDRNQVSVFNILEDIVVPRAVHVIPQAVAICSWILNSEDQGQDFQVLLNIDVPTAGDPVRAKRAAINFTAEGTRQRIHLNILNIPVERDGNIVFGLELNGKHIASHTLAVRWNSEEET